MGPPETASPSWPASPPSPFDSFSHRQKLRRAKFHIDDVETRLREWGPKGCQVFKEADAEGRTHLLAKQVEPLPDDLPLIIGDALQNLRNSLDNLAFSLALKKQGTLTLEQEQRISFPLDGAEVKVGASSIRLMASDVQEDVCALAPNPARQALDEDPLWLLNKAANRDKHRRVQPTVTAIGQYELDLKVISPYFFLHGPGRLEPGANPVVIATLGPHAEVEGEMSTVFEVLFDSPSEIADRSIIITLRWFHDYVRDTVFKRLESHL